MNKAVGGSFFLFFCFFSCVLCWVIASWSSATEATPKHVVPSSSCDCTLLPGAWPPGTMNHTETLHIKSTSATGQVTFLFCPVTRANCCRRGGMEPSRRPFRSHKTCQCRAQSRRIRHRSLWTLVNACFPVTLIFIMPVCRLLNAGFSLATSWIMLGPFRKHEVLYDGTQKDYQRK